jgi:hypothetical protein
MKKHFRIIAALLASVMLMGLMLSGCGKAEPTVEDAKKYVDSTVKLLCTGEYDKSVKFSDIEEGKETEARDAIIDEMLNQATSEYDLNDETKEQFRAFFINALAKCKYTVTDAVKTDDNGKVGYDVTVSVEPLKVFNGAEDAMTDVMLDLLSDTSVLSMSEEEVTNLVFSKIFDVLNANLENPEYAAAEDVIVHYGLMDEEKNLYGVSEEDGQKLGEKLFSSEGLE